MAAAGREAAGASVPLRAALARLTENIREQRRPLKELAADARRLHALCVAYAPMDAGDTLTTDAMVWRRLLAHGVDAPPAGLGPTLSFLAANPRTARAIALAMKPGDSVEGALGVLAEMRAERPELVGDEAGNANLVAALCLVFDAPAPAGQELKRPDALQKLEYFTRSRGQMQLPVQTLPVELLVHVVDGRASVPEMQWALKNYAKMQNIGKVYSSIVYDTAAFKYGKDKKVSEGGYTLQNIKKVGGVCTEQAYFAAEVAKSVGVPACVVTGEGADVGHAWVGYLRTVGRGVAWDFSEGRFDEYEDIEGRIVDPQTGTVTSDAFVGLTGGLLNLKPGAYERAATLTDAAASLAGATPTWPSGEEWGSPPGAPVRSSEPATQLALLKEAVTLVPGYEPAWRAVVELAGRMSSEQRREWAEAAVRMCGKDQADFELWFITPMISAETDRAAQQRMWNWAFAEFSHRSDLASRVRFLQARAVDRAGDANTALAMYREIIARYANEGRSVLEALALCEKMYARAGKPELALELYKDAFGRIHKPRNMSAHYARASTYYLVGSRYAELLRRYNRIGDSNRIRQQIGWVEPMATPPARP